MPTIATRGLISAVATPIAYSSEGGCPRSRSSRGYSGDSRSQRWIAMSFCAVGSLSVSTPIPSEVLAAKPRVDLRLHPLA